MSDEPDVGRVLADLTEAIAAHRFRRASKIAAALDACERAGIARDLVDQAAARGRAEWQRRNDASLEEYITWQQHHEGQLS